MDIAAGHLQTVKQILRRHIPDYTVWAFGSRVTGTAKPYSDLDLAVIAPQALTLAEHAALTEAFSESDLPWKVDIADWQLISEEFRELIAKQYCVIQAV